MRLIDYSNDSRWSLCDDNHKAKCEVPNWFLGLIYKEYKNIQNIESFELAVETGTYRGYTTEFLCNHFERVYSIEKYPDQNFYGGNSLREVYAQLEAKYENLQIKIGDSASILPLIIARHVNDPFVFIFDAHNGVDGPILRELEVVAKLSNNKNHIIVIDDWGDFCSHHDIIRSEIYRINPNYTIKEAPFGRAGILIAYISNTKDISEQRKTAAVVIGRNDNYGENLHQRARLCMTNLASQFDTVFYVDWKTLDKTLIEAAEIHNDKIRVISVSEEYIQNRYPEYYNYPIVETIGRNIGIRAAVDEGYEWILSTNIDCVIDKIDTGKLDINTLYTARRRNVPKEFYLNNNVDIHVLKKEKTRFTQAPVSVVDGKSVWDKGDVWSLVVCCGDFQLAHKDLWSSIRGFEEEAAGRAYADSNLMKKPILIGKQTAILDVDLFHLDHTNTSFRLPNEYLPLNDMYTFVEGFTKSSNTEDWGKLYHK